jgi:hypothetical protein
MKCQHCGAENKDAAKVCRKCGLELAVAPMWFPDARWHLRTLGTIYAALIILYLGVTAALKTLPKPYHLRKIPIEMTPWLGSGPKHQPEEKLKAPPPPENEK